MTFYINKFLADVSTEVQQSLSKVGRKRCRFKGDGNCLFRELSHVLTGEQENHAEIQLLLERFENLNNNLFKELLTSVNTPTIEEHIQHIGLTYMWGTHVEIFAISTHLHIHLFHRQSSGKFSSLC